MKVEVVPLQEIQTKKGNYIYRCLFSDNGSQEIVSIVSKHRKELNKKVSIEVRFGNFWFEK